MPAKQVVSAQIPRLHFIPLGMTGALEVPNLGRLELKLELVCDKDDEFGIGGFSRKTVIPTKAKPRGGIYALNAC